MTPAARRGGGVEYWQARAKELGVRSVVGLDHDQPVDDVSDRHREILLPILAQLLPPKGRSRVVLDLGCGVGRLTGDLAALAGRAIGVDPVAEMLALAPADPLVSYRRLEDPAGPLPLASGEVDVAFTCLVLGGIADDDALAHVGEELSRVLAPGGLVMLAESVSDQEAAEHWTFRTVAEYAAAMPWARLEKVAEFDDAGDPVSVMVGRAPE